VMRFRDERRHARDQGEDDGGIEQQFVDPHSHSRSHVWSVSGGS
jgi:hypothetical protein